MTPGTDPATWPCFACGKTYAQHADALPASGVRPRMPCLGVKASFWPRMPAATPSPAAPTGELSECRAQLQAFRAANEAAELRIVELCRDLEWQVACCKALQVSQEQLAIEAKNLRATIARVEDCAADIERALRGKPCPS